MKPSPRISVSVSWGRPLFRLSLNGENQLLDPDVVEVMMDLRLESACKFQVYGGAGGNLERDLVLQTEAANSASAELRADDADRMASRIMW